jgi:hypothetical protein
MVKDYVVISMVAGCTGWIGAPTVYQQALLGSEVVHCVLEPRAWWFPIWLD